MTRTARIASDAREPAQEPSPAPQAPVDCDHPELVHLPPGPPRLITIGSGGALRRWLLERSRRRTRGRQIAAYRQRLAERLARVDEDVAYRFARVRAAHELRWDDVRELVDMRAAKDAMFNAPVRIRSDRAQAVREQTLDDRRLK